MCPAVARLCAAFLLLCSAATFPRSQKESPNDERVWLAVEEHPRGELRIEPIATINGADLTPVQKSCLSEAETAEDFAAKFLQPGSKYSLLFGGAYAGEGQLGEQYRSGGTASFTYTGAAKIRGQARALATNAELHDFRVASRESATAEQRTAALALAREIFSEHGIPEALLPKVQVEYLTRTYLAPSALASLIGSFTLDTGDSEGLLHSLFFIASQPSEKLVPELVWLHISETEMDEEHLRLVDHADLFGNGQDEVVTKLVSLETQTHRYVIFRRTKDGLHWEQIFKTEPLGCSS
jgi:hypothetical protein